MLTVEAVILSQNGLVVLISDLIGIDVGLQCDIKIIFDFTKILEVVELAHKFHQSLTFLVQLEVGEAIGDSAGLIKDVDTLILFKESWMFVDL